MDGQIKTVYPYDSNKELSLEFLEGLPTMINGTRRLESTAAETLWVEKQNEFTSQLCLENDSENSYNYNKTFINESNFGIK